MKKIEDVEVGDLVSWGSWKYKVLIRVGDVVNLSLSIDHDRVGAWFTTKELAKDGYTPVDQSEINNPKEIVIDGATYVLKEN